jgi:hypothetical protein
MTSVAYQPAIGTNLYKSIFWRNRPEKFLCLARLAAAAQKHAHHSLADSVRVMREMLLSRVVTALVQTHAAAAIALLFIAITASSVDRTSLAIYPKLTSAAL